MRKLITGFIFLLFAHYQTAAQLTPDFEYGLGIGTAIYQGDLSPNSIGAYNRPGSNFSGFLNAHLTPFLSIRGQFAHVNIKDDERSYGSHHQHRNFSFETTVNELSALLILNPRMNNAAMEKGNLTPYAFIGAGIGFLRIQRDWSAFDHSYPFWQTWVRQGLEEDSLKVMPSSTVTIPIGLGLRYQIGEKISLYSELSHRAVRSEYLDGFSKAANQTRKDAFSTFTLGLVFSLTELGRGPGGFACPKNVF